MLILLRAPVLAWFLLVAVIACNAVSFRQPLELQNESTGNFAVRSDAEDKRVAGFNEETIDEGGERGLSFRRAKSDMDGPMITIPQFMDRMVSSAFSSMDRMSSGLLSGLAGPNIEYARSEDGERLIARLHLPPIARKDRQDAVPRKLHVAVLGRSHMRIKLDMQNDGFHASSEHTVGLPVHVSSEGVTISPQEDGTVHVSFRIVKEADQAAEVGDSDQRAGGDPESFFERRIKSPLFPTLIRRDFVTPPDSEQELVEELPKPEEIEVCRQRYPNDKIRRRKCTCDITPSKSGKAVCYGSLISKAVSVARRLGRNDFATSAKHHAIECADGHTDAVYCLEKVASELLQSLYKSDISGNQAERLEDRVRAAIESVDDGPSNFQSSYGTIVSILTIVLVLVLFACGAILCSVRRFGGSSQSNRILSELSSVLTQVAKSATTTESSSGRLGSRLGPFQTVSTSSNARVTRKPGMKPGDGESKIA